MMRGSSVVRRRRSNVVRRSRVVTRSGVVRRRSVVRRRRLSFSMCRGRLRGATWLILLLRPHGKRIGF
jgi:hypothetical protein